MIVIRLVGGLGNQMFQYATAYAVAKEAKTNLAIDLSWYTERNSEVWRMEYALGCFNISAPTIEPQKYMVVPRIGFIDRYLGNKVIEYKERGLPYDPGLFLQGNRIVMDGYWQSEKYFNDYRDEILTEFTFAPPLSVSNATIAHRMNNSASVSLHVRRGDYATNAQTTATHGLMPLHYYTEAVSSIQKRVPNAVVFIFSDDLEWCRQNIKLNATTVYVSGNSAQEDLRLMSTCKHHILANSSFSWWGAWLSEERDGIVIAPEKWFNDTNLNSKDIVPESWERL